MTRFVWIMGSDGLVDFHRWESWQGIAASVPIAVVNRPGDAACAALLARRAGACRAIASTRRIAATWPTTSRPPGYS